MLILALDTTTRAGSVALARDGVLVAAVAGDGARTHATRLPRDILALLGRHGVELADVDLYAVAVGPGSFTGLRIGIATVQGLAFANQKPVAGISALEALAHSTEEAGMKCAAPRAGLKPCSSGNQAGLRPGDIPVEQGFSPALIGAWIDAQRGEVYTELFRCPWRSMVEPARVDVPVAALDAWADHVWGTGEGLLFVGDGALAYRSLIRARLPQAVIAPVVPLLAPAVARLAAQAAEQGMAGPPHGIRPLYVRRPDAELARDRKRQATGALPYRSDDLHD